MNLDDVLQKNKLLKNVHAGRRCFLVGNGPSLNTQDITLLKDEIAIVATSFYRHQHAKVINPSYWVFADPQFWQNPEQYFIPTFNQALSKDISTRLFVPSGGFNFFTQVNRGPLIDLYFYHYDHTRDITTPINFSTGIPPYGQNVMHVSLMLALYLGCNPIYFIGCDRDYWNMTKQEYNTFFIEHFYEESGVNNKCTEHMPWEQWLQGKARTEQEVVQLKQYASLRGFDIYNATNGGYFDTFPRVQYESLFAPSPNLLKIGAVPDERDQRDAHHLGTAAIRLMNAGDLESADALLDEAMKCNINTTRRALGLHYTKALCLARLGKYAEALIHARCDHTANTENRDKSEPLIRELEDICGNRTGGPLPA
jgi:hypothetical protein